MRKGSKKDSCSVVPLAKRQRRETLVTDDGSPSEACRVNRARTSAYYASLPLNRGWQDCVKWREIISSDSLATVHYRIWLCVGRCVHHKPAEMAWMFPCFIKIYLKHSWGFCDFFPIFTKDLIDTHIDSWDFPSAICCWHACDVKQSLMSNKSKCQANINGNALLKGFSFTFRRWGNLFKWFLIFWDHSWVSSRKLPFS